MKSPRSLRPSGDRRIARLFIDALTLAGFEVALASELRSWEGQGSEEDQYRIKNEADSVARNLIDQWRAQPVKNRPCAWFTYHLYHKAPDWIGPQVSEALGIPYFIAEASIADKQRGGQWAIGFDASIAAIQQSTRIFTLNPGDASGLANVPGCDQKIVAIKPFLDYAPWGAQQKHSVRQRLAARLKVTPDQYWLLTVAMMREDSKLESYQQLANAISGLQRKDWQLFIVGDGAAELMVRDCFRFDVNRQVHFLGKRDAEFIREIMGASDLFLWPAINEAIGMAALEALACGLPAICGRSGGIDQIIDHRKTGLLIEAPHAADACQSFTRAIEELLEAPDRLAAMSRLSIEKYRSEHHLNIAAQLLGETITPLLSDYPNNESATSGCLHDV